MDVPVDPQPRASSHSLYVHLHVLSISIIPASIVQIGRTIGRTCRHCLPKQWAELRRLRTRLILPHCVRGISRSSRPCHNYMRTARLSSRRYSDETDLCALEHCPGGLAAGQGIVNARSSIFMSKGEFSSWNFALESVRTLAEVACSGTRL